MPAAQGEVTNREVRFTLRFRTTITIAARSAHHYRHRVGRNTPHHDGSRQMIGRRAASAAIREFTACRIPNSRAMTRLEQAGSETTGACERSMMSRGRLQRPAPDARAIGAFRGTKTFRGTRRSRGERGRRRTRQDQISCRALGPVKLRVVRTRTERRKTCFFCRTGFEGAGFF